MAEGAEEPPGGRALQGRRRVLAGHPAGVSGLDDAVPDLTEALEREDQHPAVRLAAARALIDLGAKKAAAGLWRQAQKGGIDLREVVEPAPGAVATTPPPAPSGWSASPTRRPRMPAWSWRSAAWRRPRGEGGGPAARAGGVRPHAAVRQAGGRPAPGAAAQRGAGEGRRGAREGHGGARHRRPARGRRAAEPPQLEGGGGAAADA